jgi:hypothetical protein
MILPILSLMLMRQSAPDSPNPAQIVSKMLARYQHWKTLSGSILLTMSAGKSSGRMVTTINAKSPNLVCIKQEPDGTTDTRTYVLLSNGTVFRYPAPSNLPGSDGKSVQESVNQDGVLLDVQDIYGIGAPGLKDRSAPLDVAFGRLPDLQSFKSQLASIKYDHQEQMRGKLCDVVSGGWRPYARHVAATDANGNPIDSTVQPEANYRLTISQDGDLMRYEIFSVEAFNNAILDPENKGKKLVQASTGPIPIHATWDVALETDGQVDETQFQIL